MRTVNRLLTLLGGVALVLAVVIDLGWGNPSHAAWVVLGPLPFYLAGLVAHGQRPENGGARWLLATGSLFALSTLLGDSVLPLWRTAPVALVAQWASLGGAFALVGLIGLFPDGRPRSTLDRAVLWVVGLQAVLLPVVGALANPTLTVRSYAEPGTPAVVSPFFVEALAPLGSATAQLDELFPLWAFAGVGLLALRYRREPPSQRRQIRLLIVGCAAGLVLALALVLAQVWLGVESLGYTVLSVLLWPLTAVLVIGSLLVALTYEGVFGIDAPARRRQAHAVLRVLIVLGVGAVAASLGLLVAAVADTGAAVLAAVIAAVALQPARKRLERLTDRWVFGARLDGYALLVRFGAVLDRAPDRAHLAVELADTVRHGLELSWARADVGGAEAVSGRPAGEPALVVAIRDGDRLAGRIECGARRDGNPLLTEDRRLLSTLAGQTATAARTLRLADELSERLLEIERQAAELAASRDRVITAQDAERRRIQRDLHDGVQQEVVALTAKVGLARQRLGRGDPSAESLLTEVQADLGTLLGSLREVAHAIHPPVLADRGLVSAVEAHAARLPVAMAVRADPALREGRLPPRIEATAWYALAEALSNVVKHAAANQVEVVLRRPDGHLALEVRDDGQGFDPAAQRGLGLTGLADRLDIVGGSLVVESRAGAGTTLRMNIPLGRPDE